MYVSCQPFCGAWTKPYALHSGDLDPNRVSLNHTTSTRGIGAKKHIVQRVFKANVLVGWFMTISAKNDQEHKFSKTKRVVYYTITLVQAAACIRSATPGGIVLPQKISVELAPISWGIPGNLLGGKMLRIIVE